MDIYSTFRDAVEDTVERRRDFFRLIFGDEHGYVCIAYKGHTDRSFGEKLFEYPAQLDQMCKDIDERALTLTHVYFCPQLLKDPTYRRGADGKSARVKENVKTCTVLWADLDTCNPQNLQVPASIVVQSSSGRWQSFWRLESAVAPEDAEAVCLKIAYFHAEQGADRSGWDLTQLMRVPYTPNYKYGDLQTAPIVVVSSTNAALYRLSDFDTYPAYEALKFVDNPVPVDEFLPDEPAVDILQRYRSTLNPSVFSMFDETPQDGQDWSATQWKLAKLLSEAGLTREECFVVVKGARCNKYARDRRPDSALWTEIKKVYVKEAEYHNLIPTPTAVIPDIISDEEVRLAQSRVTFVERYINWATKLSDAAPQYHQAGAFMILSAMISGSVRLPTSFGMLIPNLWFMILADTTLTRKTTSMRIATNLLEEISPTAIMATDGSAEGILSALRDRAHQPSIYLRDEFAGLLDAMTHKDYMAGMAETFTKLYDGDSLKRLLRKDEIKINHPIFLMYTGGTKTKIQDLLTESHIESGFIPRFIFITAVADPERVRPVGPPQPINIEEKKKITDELFDINLKYNAPRLIVMPDGKTSGNLRPQYDAQLTPRAWLRYNKLETTLTKAAMDTGLPHLTAVYDRLAKSTLKAALLIAASEQGEDGDVTVDLQHIIHAAYYCQHWFIYASEIVNGIGKSQDERLIDKIVNYATEAGRMGVSRSDIMRKFMLDSKRADLIMTTIIQRRLLFSINLHGQPRYHGG